jgi:hypothetical protein
MLFVLQNRDLRLKGLARKLIYLIYGYVAIPPHNFIWRSQMEAEKLYGRWSKMRLYKQKKNAAD